MADSSFFFQDITLQQPLMWRLQQELAQHSHAYLFSGAPGSGKKSLALRFAFALLAQSDVNAPLFFREKQHPDLLVLQRMEKKSRIALAQLTEELIPWLGYKPYQSQKKVAVILEAHTLNMEGANALLKTLEEPPDYAVLILVADEDNLPETISSRCRLVHFPAISLEEMQAFLKKQDCPAENIREIALLSRGNASLARELMTKNLPDLHKKAAAFLRRLQNGERSAVFELSQALETEGVPLFQVLWMQLRDELLRQKTHEPQLLLQENAAAGLSLRFSPQLRENWEKIQKMIQYFDTNVNTSLLWLNIAWTFYHCLEQE